MVDNTLSQVIEWVRKVKAKLELNLAKDTMNNRKGFYS